MTTKLGYLLQITNDGVVRLDLGAYAGPDLEVTKAQALAWFIEDEGGDDEAPDLEWSEQLDRAPGEPRVWRADFGLPDYPAWYVITECTIDVA